jgi:hypothetical protein
MTLSVTNFGNNAQQPSVNAEAYIPDRLIAGNLKLVTDTQIIVSGAAKLPRGTVLGKITATGKFTIALSAAGDGSQTPIAILADDADPTSGDVNGALYLTGEFNGSQLNLGTGITLAAATAALRSVGIFVKTSVTASDPT